MSYLGSDHTVHINHEAGQKTRTLEVAAAVAPVSPLSGVLYCGPFKGQVYAL